jgi:hypothetical protein
VLIYHNFALTLYFILTICQRTLCKLQQTYVHLIYIVPTSSRLIRKG